jgi:hypothetical protein
MPDHLKNNPDSKEFNQYLQKFMQRKLNQHRVKALKQAVSSLATAVTL